jgi:hypothetical protein
LSSFVWTSLGSRWQKGARTFVGHWLPAGWHAEAFTQSVSWGIILIPSEQMDSHSCRGPSNLPWLQWTPAHSDSYAQVVP